MRGDGFIQIKNPSSHASTMKNVLTIFFLSFFLALSPHLMAVGFTRHAPS